MTVDESPPNTDLKKKRRKRFIFVAVAVVLWYVIAYVVFGEFTGEAFVYGEKQGIYWLECHEQASIITAALAPFITIALLLLIPGFLMNQYDNQLFTAFILAVLVLGVYPLFGPRFGQLRHVQTVRYGGHTYHLAGRTRYERHPDACLHDDSPNCTEWEVSYEYLIYQCGQKGIVCHNIGYQTFDDYGYASGELSVDEEGNLILEVDGKWFWTYPEDDQ